MCSRWRSDKSVSVNIVQTLAACFRKRYIFFDLQWRVAVLTTHLSFTPVKYSSCWKYWNMWQLKMLIVIYWRLWSVDLTFYTNCQPNSDLHIFLLYGTYALNSYVTALQMVEKEKQSSSNSQSTFYYPTMMHTIIKSKNIKTIKIPKVAPTCFGSSSGSQFCA
jgi:hypothetical protein